MSIKLFFCGDIVNTKEVGDFIDGGLKKIIQQSDLAVANLEAPIEHKDMVQIPKAGPHIYQKRSIVSYLMKVGFSMVSLANNHIYDYGQRGLEETILEVNANNLSYVGAGQSFEEAYQPKIIEKNGIKIGFIAAAENEFGCLYEYKNRGGYAWIFHPLIEDNIKILKEKVDYIVLIAHAGVEDIPIPIKEWRDRYKRLCDIGVDVVIGHHPHVPQGYEKYKESFIFYSLGNFYFDYGDFSRKKDDSYSLLLSFTEDKKITFDIIYHKKKDGKVCIVDKNNVSFDMKNLSSLLKNDYEKSNDLICKELFNKYYYKYYFLALKASPHPKSVWYVLKNVLLRIFFRRSCVNGFLLLLHNIRIDSHRFVVQRALSLLVGEENEA
ncbi:MAG: CapA family protein [Brevinematales bacterium]|nr:CapA family protein [Brevinematales bacterium]